MARKAKKGSAEAEEPEKVAELILAAADPLASLTDIAERAGIDPRVAYALMRRIKARNYELTTKLKQLKTTDLLRKMDSKIDMVFEYMDDAAMAGASFRDLAIGLGILLEKRQLLRGEPTQILSVEERKHVNDLMPMILEEAVRRGFTIGLTPSSAKEEEGVAVRLIPQEQEKDKFLSRTLEQHKPQPLKRTIEHIPE